MSALKQHQQDLLFLAYCENMSDVEIAPILNISPNAVKKRRQRILKKMQKQFTSEEECP